MRLQRLTTDRTVVKYMPLPQRTINQLFDLSGRVALVTGGSRGLGREMAEGLAEAGASLMTCDVSKASDVQAVVDRAVAVYGTIDILVNNAGVSWGALAEDMPLEKWQKVIDVNLTGTFLFSQAAGRVMIAKGYGRIINISSLAGVQSSVNGPRYAGYAASKAGMIGLTRELAASWGRHNIRVNAIAPGFFHSRLADPVIGLVEDNIKEHS